MVCLLRQSVCDCTCAQTEYCNLWTCSFRMRIVCLLFAVTRTQNRDVHVIVRLLLHSLLCKIAATARSFAVVVAAPAWPNLFALLASVEHFVLRTPLENRMQRVAAERVGVAYAPTLGLHFDDAGASASERARVSMSLCVWVCVFGVLMLWCLFWGLVL
jgi:hypothetical protein